MSRKLTSEERLWIVKEFTRTENQRAVVRNWPFLTTRPSRHAVQSLVQKFNENGTLLNMPKSGRRRNILTNINTNIVADLYMQEPRNSIRKTSAELDIHRSSVWRILKSLNMKAYIPTLVQGLLERDPVDRFGYYAYQILIILLLIN